MQDKDYSDEHKHCTMQPFDTAFGGGGQGPAADFWMGARGPCSSLRTVPASTMA